MTMRYSDVTLTQKNFGQMQANIDIRRIAREKGIEFHSFLAKMVNSKLWRELADAHIYKLETEPVLTKINNYEIPKS